MNILIIEIIMWIIFLFIFFPIFLFLFYLIFDGYNKLYLNLIGVGKKWYQYLFIFPISLLSWKNHNYIKKNSRNGNINKHIAIVLANNYFPENIHSFGLDGVIKLIKYLKKNNKSYVVYNRVNSDQLKNIINDKRVYSILLFGHGERHGLKVGKNEIVYYCEFKNHPKKHLIAQFHCNHYSGKSLSEYGEKPIFSFVTNNMQNYLSIEKQIKKIIKEKIL
ncbi:MAG: hypothetical protein KKD48_04150 [Nanoarchaeota archaeon]|nr:hypothetical protein [Nanoarchaeota archaeon]